MPETPEQLCYNEGMVIVSNIQWRDKYLKRWMKSEPIKRILRPTHDVMPTGGDSFPGKANEYACPPALGAM